MTQDEQIDKLIQAVEKLTNAMMLVHGRDAAWQPVGSGTPEHEKEVRKAALAARKLVHEVKLDRGMVEADLDRAIEDTKP